MNTILLIEDDTAIRENTFELLDLKGYHVLTAANGKIGLRLAKDQKPDVILCDIMMPEVDGYTVFTELKEDPQTSSIPFIFLTASVEKKEVEKAFGMGVQGYIRKPFDTEELFNAISECLSKNR